jgi:predicted nicotinamide N-methyase
MYWIETIYETPWIDDASRARLMKVLLEAESGSGWVLVTSYRIPILWEHVHLNLAKNLYSIREKQNESTSKTD